MSSACGPHPKNRLPLMLNRIKEVAAASRRRLLRSTPSDGRRAFMTTLGHVNPIVAVETRDAPIHTFLGHIIDNPSIYNIIFCLCPAITLVRLLQTCSRVRAAVMDYMSYNFSVDRLLSRYFSHPITFRYIQARSATIISGSTALQFFDRTFYPESDLDLYIPMAWRERLGCYLLNEGYTFSPSPKQHPTFHIAVSDREVLSSRGRYGHLKAIAGVFNFTKLTALGQLRIQMMVAVRSTLEVILNYHSTCVMNLITFDKAYCLYPRATLEDRTSLICTSRDDEVIERVYDRYRERGWTMVTSYEQVEPLTLPSLQVGLPRSIEGGYTWVITLPCDFYNLILPVTPRSTPLTSDPVSASSWTLVENNEAGPHMKFGNITHPQLFYAYVLSTTRVMRLPAMRLLMEMASRANFHPPRQFSVENHQYVDERFIQLYREFLNIILP
ncbi:hypothetical protein QCA50_018320 [Cerrena zonata]|uniref:Uncharacterized protein n=1 Tax=Cerrena zonata TaxID=2478898 RepID=A0AAW0FMC1_9APHY